VNDLNPQVAERELMKIRNRQSVQELAEGREGTGTQAQLENSDDLAPTANNNLVRPGAEITLLALSSRKWKQGASNLVSSRLRKSASESALSSHIKSFQEPEDTAASVDTLKESLKDKTVNQIRERE